MAWYEDERKESHTETYENAELAAQDAHRAEAKGWQVQAKLSHVRAPYGLLAPFNLGNHQRGEVELTFVRTEEWLEQHRRV
jgi:hypothetical protein